MTEPPATARGAARWRLPEDHELPEIIEILRGADGDQVAYTQLLLADIAKHGVANIRASGGLSAIALTTPARVLVPVGDPQVIADSGVPSRRWRLLLGERTACDAILSTVDAGTRILQHDQILYRLGDALPELPRQVEFRQAIAMDVDQLADLAVQLHVDDSFGPDPGWMGRLGYRQRMASTTTDGVVWVIGPVGRPFAKLEFAAGADGVGAQIAGIVVDRRHRGKGLGRWITLAAAHKARQLYGPDCPITLHVRAANEHARHVYEQLGFEHAQDWRLAIRT